MLRYTGHPLVDVGVATITAFAGKIDPSEVTAADLNAVAAYIEGEYSKNPMKSFLQLTFQNSGFVNPTMGFDKRSSYLNMVLRGWQNQQLLDEKCVFLGTPAVAKVFRETIPMIGSGDNFNFYSAGESGLPVSGLALLAIQAFPLGCVKCSGRVLLMHADDPNLTYRLAAQALEANRRYLNLAAQADKYEDAKFPHTQIIERLLRAEMAREDWDVCSVTAYHLTNYGTNAAVRIYYLPLQITRFLADATDATYHRAWHRIIERGWEGNITEPERDTFGLPARRNVLYEDLFALPRDARRFLRTYILRMPRVQKTKDDPRVGYRLLDDLDLVSWPLTTLFLKEVMNVDETRIEAIRAMADRLADYIDEQGDQRLFKTLLYGGSRGQDYQVLRTRLIRADYDQIASHEPLFTLDQFVAVFENSDSQYTWMLARDLLLIRIIERLHERGKIAQFREIISTPQDSSDLETA